MSQVATLAIAAAVVLTLMLLLQLGISAGDDDEDDEDGEGAPPPPPPGIEARVERYIGLLNYADEPTAAEASRSLLSMGPNILPVLLRHLGRLEERPGALSPACQLHMEELLTSFGLVTYLACAEHMRGVHRGSPVFPAMMRIFVGIGPNLLVEVARNPVLDPAAVLGPLLHRTGPAALGPLAELLRAQPDALPEPLLLAAMPLFAGDPGALRRLLAAVPPAGEARLLGALAPWCAPAALEHMAGCQPADLPPELEEGWIAALAWRAVTRDDPAALLEEAARWAALPPSTDPWSLHTRTLALDGAPLAALWQRGPALHLLPHPAPSPEAPPRQSVEWALAALDGDDLRAQRLAVRLLGAAQEDPRAVERLIVLAAHPAAPWGWLALAELAREDKGPLEDALVARLRASSTPADLFYGRLALRRCPRLAATLYRLLRAEAAQPVAAAAHLLAAVEVSAEGLLKALGRHRYSPLEAEIVPLLWAQGHRLRPRLVACLQDADREIRQGAVDALGGYGGAEAATPLLERLTPEAESPDSLINAVELIGPPAADALAAFIERRPEVARDLLLQRRLELLRRSARREDHAP